MCLYSEPVSLIVPSSSFKVLDLVLKSLWANLNGLWHRVRERDYISFFSICGYPVYLGPFVEEVGFSAMYIFGTRTNQVATKVQFYF